MMIAFDVETYIQGDKGELVPELDATLFTVGAIAKEEGKTEVFYDREKMYQRILELGERERKRGKSLFVYGHNIEYDFCSVMRNHLTDQSYVYFSKNPFIVFKKESNGKGNITFVDTMNFYKTNLKSIGQDVLGFEKLEMPEKIYLPSELEKYVSRDAEVTLRIMTSLKEKLKEIGINTKKLYTMGQVSMNAFLTEMRKDPRSLEFMNRRGGIIQTPYEDLQRFAMRGGRVEAFQVGEYDDATLVDLNSLYPYAMTQIDFPRLKKEYFIKKPYETFGKKIFNYTGVMKARIKVKDIDIGFLPIKTKNIEGRQILVFPNDGEMEGLWTIPEISKALKLGYEIISSEYAFLYKKMEWQPLKQHIEKLYKLRMMSDKLTGSVVKGMMNSLYGKFSQRRRSGETISIEFDELDSMLETHEFCGVIGNKYIMKSKEKGDLPRFARSLISALITAKAREILYDNLVKIPKEDLLYCDTDSIMFKGDHKEKFDIGVEMGKWKIEKENENTIIRGEKKYLIGDDVKVSGISRREAEGRRDILIDMKPVKTKRMISIHQSFKMGKPELAGKFQEVEVNLINNYKALLKEFEEYKDFDIYEEERKAGIKK